MSIVYDDTYDEVATIADRAALWLQDGVDAGADLARVAELLDTLQLDESHAQLLARSIRKGLDAVELWLRATSSSCRLAVEHDRAINLPALEQRLGDLSWAWGRLPLYEPSELKAADEALAARRSTVCLEVSAEKPLR